MCDVRIFDGWWKPHSCSRNGKYAIEVIEDRYNSNSQEVMTIHVCGQHKNQLGEGRTLSVRPNGAKADVPVKGKQDERGIAKNRVEKASWDYDNAKSLVSVHTHRVGTASTNAAEELIEMFEGYEDGPLRTLVLSLRQYKDALDQQGAAYRELAEAEFQYNNAKEKA